MSDEFKSRWNRDVLFSTKKHDHGTPRKIFEELNEEFNYTLDPCTNPDNPLGTPNFYTIHDDGLNQSWENERAFVNPEYGRQYPKWVKKAYDEVKNNGCELATLLIPSRTDTVVFHDYCTKGKIWFYRGRLTFEGNTNPAPFATILVIFKKGEL